MLACACRKRPIRETAFTPPANCSLSERPEALGQISIKLQVVDFSSETSNSPAVLVAGMPATRGIDVFLMPVPALHEFIDLIDAAEQDEQSPHANCRGKRLLQLTGGQLCECCAFVGTGMKRRGCQENYFGLLANTGFRSSSSKA
jgi:hypothetical protein